MTKGSITVLITVDNGLKYHLIGLLHFRPEEGITPFDAYRYMYPKTKVPQKPQGQLKGNIYRRATYNIKLLLTNDA